MLKLKSLFAVSLIVLGGFLVVLFPSQVLAQSTPDNFDVTVSPVFFDFTSKPGTTVKGQVRLRNNTNSPLPIKVDVKKLGGDQNGDLTIQNAPDETIGWFKVDNSDVLAPSREWVTVPFSLTVPDSAAYGYYWALSFTQNADTSTKGTGAKVNASIVVPVLLNVAKAGAKTEGKITEFSADSSWYEYLPVNFKTVFENTGNVHVRPTGNIFIKDWTGRTVATLDVNPNQGAILPGTKKTMENTWSDSFVWYENKIVDGKTVLDKNGKPEKQLKIRFDKILDLRVGKYTATNLMVISSGTRDIAIEKSISFFVFPWKIIIGSIVFVVFALLGAFSTIKSTVKRIKGWFGKDK